MNLFTPKMVRKLDPDAVWLAKVEEVVEARFTDTQARYMLRFGDMAFEAFSESRHDLPAGRSVICFTPSVREYNGEQDVILTLLGSTCVTEGLYPSRDDTGDNDFHDAHDGVDPSDAAREREALDFEIAAHNATT